METSELQSTLQDNKDKLLNLINSALLSIGLAGVDISSIRLRAARRGLICPAGETAVFEAVEHPDGTVTMEWVCRKS